MVYSPEAITLASDVTPIAISANDLNSLAIGSNEKLYAWGYNAKGELGDGTTIDQDSPEVITLATNVSPVIISAGFEDGLAIGSDGKLYAWGDSVGQLGDGTTIVHESPEVITLASGVLPTATSPLAMGFSLAIGSDGKLYAWGTDGRSQLGDSMTTTQVQTPEAITLASGVFPTAISAGSYHSLAIGSDGKLYTWGENSAAQLGNGTTSAQDGPAAITLASGVFPTAISAGSFHSLAIGSDGKLYTWGTSNYGELGDGKAFSVVETPEALASLSGSALLPSPPATPTVLRSDPTATSMPGDTTQTASSVTVQPTTDPALR